MTAGLHRYSHHALRALAHATTLANGFQHPYQDTGHLLIGVMLADGSVGAQVMDDLNVTPELVGVYLKRMLPRVENVPQPMPRSVSFEKAIEDALMESDWLGNHYIGTEHMLLGITRIGQGNAGELLRLVDISPEQIRRRVKTLLQSRETEFNLTAARANIRLSELSRRVLNAAEQTALSLEHATVGIGHLMLALVQERRGITSDILKRSGLNQKKLNDALDRRDSALLSGLEPILTTAIEQAGKLGSHYVGADHLLLTLTLIQPGIVALQAYDAEVDRIHRLLTKHLQGDPIETQERRKLP